MPKSKKQSSQQDSLPEDFGSLEEFWEFWDTHSTSDYEDFMEDVDVSSEVDLLISNGRYYWRVNVTDNVSYENTSEIQSYIIDGKAPGCYYTYPEAGDRLNDPTPTFNWKFFDYSEGNPGSGLDEFIFKVGLAVDSRGEISDPIINETFDDPQEDVEYEYTHSLAMSDGSYYWSVTAYDGIGNWQRRWTVSPFVIDNTPVITSFAPDNPVIDIKNATREFNITVDQTIDVVWMINNRTLQTNTSVIAASYTNTSASSGIWNISAMVNNTNGTDMQTWQWNVTEMSVRNLNTDEYFETIQAAINDNDTLNRHTISVDQGIYNENVVVTKSLTIRSTSENPADTVIQTTDLNDHIINISADYVNISGFSLIGSDGLNHPAGIYLNEVNHCELSNNNASKNGCGIHLFNSNNNTLTNNTISNNSDTGIYLDSSNNNMLTGNIAKLNFGYGFNLISSNNNSIYNNYFNNMNNAYDNGINTWNSTLNVSINIIGGPFTGGNYWSDYTGFGTSGDGLGDEPYNISGGSNQDHLPLVHDMCGDVDDDRDVDTDDVYLLLDHVFAGAVINEQAGDVDGSGGINMLDVRLLMNHVTDRVGYGLNCTCVIV